MLPSDDETTLDSIYTHDAGIATSKGIIICNMGKEARKNEPKALKNFLFHNNISVVGEIKYPDIYFCVELTNSYLNPNLFKKD